jgi:integrase
MIGEDMARSRTQKGWIRHRGDVWTIHYRVRSGDGWVQKTETVTKAKKKSDAQKALDRRIAGVNAANDPHKPRVTNFASFASGPHWQSYLKKHRLKPSTVGSYQSMLDRIVLPAIGDRTIDDVSPQDIAALLNGLEAAGRSGKYALNVYAMLTVMFSVAEQLELVERSPMRPKIHRPLSEKREKPALTCEQIRAIEAAFPPELRALCLCVALTGLRLGELLGLRWCDVDLDARVMTVAHSLWRGQLVEPKTEASKRRVRMSRMMTARLSEHRDGSRWSSADDFIFAREDGSPQDPDHLRNQVLYPAMKAAGITRVARAHGFHIFRHSAASILYAERGDLKETQEFLGHARTSTTADIYTHVDAKIIEQGAETLAETIWPGPIEVEGVQ